MISYQCKKCTYLCDKYTPIDWNNKEFLMLREQMGRARYYCTKNNGLVPLISVNCCELANGGKGGASIRG